LREGQNEKIAQLLGVPTILLGARSNALQCLGQHTTLGPFKIPTKAATFKTGGKRFFAVQSEQIYLLTLIIRPI